MLNWSFCNLRYLRTPMGAVKLINVVTGAISLILVAVSYVPVWTLDVFIGTVTACLILSILHIAFYLVAGSRAIHSKANKVVSFLFQVLAGAALIVSGIELIGWSEYKDPTCRRDCPKLYTVGVAKTLTFMNGTLYLIIAFLGIKDDDMLDPDAADEDIPLLSSTAALAGIPGKFAGSRQSLQHSISSHQTHHLKPNNQHYYYDNFFRQPAKFSYDQRSIASSNRSRPPPPKHVTAEYAFNTSYNSTTPHNPIPNTGGGSTNNGGGNNGRRISKTSISNQPVSMATSATSADLQLIRE